MIFSSGLPLSFLVDAVQYAAYVLNRSTTDANAGEVSPIQILINVAPNLSKFVVLVPHAPLIEKFEESQFAKRAQRGFNVGIGDGTKRYQVFVPKDHIVVTTQHIRNIDTLDNEQNLILERQYLSVDEDTNAESAAPDETKKLTSSITRASTKSTWTRECPLTRSRKIHATEAGTGVVNNVTDAGPSNYRDAIKSVDKNKWESAIQDEVQALENNQVWKMMVTPCDAHCLHTKWVYKTKRDANGNLERYKARLVAVGNEQVFCRDYNVTFAAVMEMSRVKLILALARVWRVPAQHGNIPNAYVKAEKEPELNIYLRIPQVMDVD
uniref:Pol polyprotein fruit fly (Drosophila melanogaster) transposon n=1 Tax=Albugo laibachii Nc14 TaxID=890382 RepID=F0WY56_9STRA|nr:pol polyprotein fruit fly (Drosophila melanogaster) transposon [Albugo laibachii Nc14]|eukprot:CCA26407.1 pol polyprotein fruit fly (Drosophila melanogaster) transposon [Albugo laibachii Nc14]